MIDSQWVQGALLEPSATRNYITEEDVSETDVLIVISQSCDIVCVSYDVEPFVELHVGHSIGEIDGNNAFGKSPRVLDFQTTVNGGDRKLRILDRERKRVPRQVLERAVPIGVMPEADVRMVSRWTANRYTRPALPDAFNARRAKAKDAITKLASRDAKDVTGFYIALNTFDELSEGTDYELALLSITRKTIADDAVRFAGVIKVTEGIGKLLNDHGIRVVDVIARSAANVSLEDIALYSRLELDHLSERNGGERPVE